VILLLAELIYSGKNTKYGKGENTIDMREGRSAQRLIVTKPEGERSHRRFRSRLEENTEVVLK
jgi:hypothetical protein